MKKLRLFGLLIALVVSVPAIAQNAFNGTWKFNLNDAQFPKKPDVFLLQDGMYHCKTCVPPIDPLGRALISSLLDPLLHGRLLCDMRCRRLLPELRTRKSAGWLCAVDGGV